MSPAAYIEIRAAVSRAGFAGEIEWSETVQPPATADDFALEAAFVICNSGMKNTIARAIFEKVRPVLRLGRSATTVFHHRGKARAIDTIWRDRVRLYREFQEADDKVAFCGALPWIGDITKYHLAKNFGVDCCKPDRHLVRIAEKYDTTPEDLCARLAAATGDRIATVDYVLWRAAAEGMST